MAPKADDGRLSPSVFLGPFLQVVLVIVALLFVLNTAVRKRINRGRWQRPSKRELSRRTARPEGVHVDVSWWEDVGLRPYMEDRHHVCGNFGDHERRSYFGVFDGHGGSRAAEFARRRLHKLLLEEMARPGGAAASAGSGGGGGGSSSSSSGGGSNGGGRGHGMAHSLTRAFERADEQFLALAANEALGDGSTLLVAIVEERRVYVANAGDCRAVLVKRGGKAVALSEDHKPNLPRESKRIKESGGHVYFDGSWRVEGILAVARALGDMLLKPYVTATPDVVEHEVSDDDLYLILASDGLWDTISNEEAARIVLSAADFKAVAAELVERAQDADSMDNITALVIKL